MISSRKLDANRANARASTGPKSPSGKARSASNALRHGLTIPVGTDHELTGQAHELARRFAGNTDSPEIQRLATLAANAQVDIDRIRQAACDLMGKNSTPSGGSAGELHASVPDEQTTSAQVQRGTDKKLLDLIYTLREYERRAISRRNRAFQDIDCQRVIESVAGKMP